MTNNFVFSTKDSGEYEGRMAMCIQYGNADKVVKVSLANPYTRSAQENDQFRDMVEDPENMWCIVKLWLFYFDYYLPKGWEGRVFRRKATQKELKVLYFVCLLFRLFLFIVLSIFSANLSI